MMAEFVRNDLEHLREWARRLRRESTCSVVQHEPRDCGELAALLEAHLGEADLVTHARTCGCRECLAPEEAVLSSAPIVVDASGPVPKGLAPGVVRYVEQPAPRPSGLEVLPHALKACRSEPLAALLRVRQAVGLERYGVALCAHNGRDAERDAREELADAVMYLTQRHLESGESRILAARSFVVSAWEILEGRE